ncbi:MAG: DNA-directed RNA polymerase subunit alpha [Flavobacteriales bacterium]|nr:DNA-directed RNA polymerase subunit alpha [Flavobacteriales bacterium]MBT5699334.1 DNA-directed RNA polymerase subunit alpha [Flavobacteriales bacterium]MBT6815347.1 DNA-directed RNA polymerase subunit alpha [Flavobacteriales bacterium]MBT7727042.1 DNA-directed RNA polymerase subunit alpha [Flavobacteriales bacterium]
MSILNFQKPDEVIMLDSAQNEGLFEFRPLEPGFGLTVGNALRRVLLSSLEGFAITSIKIKGVDHEFTTIKGVVEDVTEIILNLKQVRFKQQIEDENIEIATMKISKKSMITAADLGSSLSNFQVLNPEQIICTTDKKTDFEMEFTIEKGRGYVPAEENQDDETALGTISIDSIFTPIKNVKYNVENYRVEQKTDFEKLNVNIITDGSIDPKEALTEAAKILIQHFMLFSDEKINFDTEDDNEFDEDSLHMSQLLKTTLVDLGLSVRSLNCLKHAEVFTLGELVSFSKNDLLKFRNFGKKSLTELEELVEEKNLHFGFDVSKYNLN